MAKRKRQKVKHYHRSFYSRNERLKQILGGVALAAAALGLAWLAAPYVLNWATHTWYTVVKNRDLSAPPAAVSTPAPPSGQSEPMPEASPMPTPTPEPTPEPKPLVPEGSWASVELSALTDEESIRTAAEALKKQGVTYAAITLKETDGKLAYSSSHEVAAANAGRIQIDPGLVASVFAEEGLIPVARLAVFRDPAASYTDRSMGIHYSNTDSMWLDNTKDAGGKPWLNPYSEGAVQYITDLIEEVNGFGFAHILLANVQFPAGESSRQNFGDTQGRTRAEQLAMDIAVWQQRFANRAVLWYEYALSNCTAPGSALGALPPELGVVNLAIRLPSAAKDKPKAEKLAEVVQQNKTMGAEYVVVWDGGSAAFYEEER